MFMNYRTFTLKLVFALFFGAVFFLMISDLSTAISKSDMVTSIVCGLAAIATAVVMYFSVLKDMRLSKVKMQQKERSNMPMTIIIE